MASAEPSLSPNYANPVLSPNAQDVLSGSGVVTLNRKPLFRGWSPGFLLNATRIVYNGGSQKDKAEGLADDPGVQMFDRELNVRTQIDPVGANTVSAGGPRYAYCRDGVSIQLSGQPLMKGRLFAVTVDDTGACAWLEQVADKGHNRLYVRRQGQEKMLIAEGPFSQPRLRHGALVFRRNEFSGGQWKGTTWGLRIGKDTKPYRLGPLDNQYEAMPVKVPGRILILTYDETRLLIFPMKPNATKGWVVGTGTTLNPDARKMDESGEELRVVAFTKPAKPGPHGLFDMTFDLRQPMVAL